MNRKIWSLAARVILVATAALGPRCAVADFWTAWENMGASSGPSPSSARTMPNRLDVFNRAPNGHLTQRTWASPGSWTIDEDLGGVELTSAPSALGESSGSGRTFSVFYRGPNQHLWMSTHDGGTWWSAPADLGGVQLLSAPSAVELSINHLRVYYKGPNGHLWVSAWDQGPWWGPPVDLGGIELASAPAAAATQDGEIRVFFRGANSHLFETSWHSGQMVQTDLGVKVTGDPAAVAWKDRRFDVFYRGLGDHIWVLSNLDGSAWAQQNDLDGTQTSSSPTASVWGGTRLDVFAVGSDGRLWHTNTPAPFDVHAFRWDANGFPKNPKWGQQLAGPDVLANEEDCLQGPRLAGTGGAWLPPCTSQFTWKDTNKALCPVGELGGHANWTVVSMDGTAYWNSHSLESQDDDYNIDLYRDDHASLTVDSERPPVLKGAYAMHMEFSSDETIDHFRTPWWKRLHAAVDSDDSRSIDAPFSEVRRQLVSGSSEAHALIDGHAAVAIGLLGLDCAHSCGAELHPIYALALAMNASRNFEDDAWAIFVRNSGNEGYCSSGLELLDVKTLTMALPAPMNATGVEVREGTQFLFGPNDMSTQDKAAVSGPLVEFVPGEGARVTFTLPRPEAHGRINGELHLRWTFATSAAREAALVSARFTVIPRVINSRPTEKEEEPEEQLAETLHKLSPAQRATFLRAFPHKHIVPDMQTLRVVQHAQRAKVRSHSSPSKLTPTRRVQDRSREENSRLRRAALKAALDTQP